MTVVRYAELQLEDGQGLSGRLADNGDFAIKLWQHRLDFCANDGYLSVWSVFDGIIPLIDEQIFISLMISRRARDRH